MPRKTNYQCEICGKCSNNKQNLDIHIKSLHEDSPDFKCDICQKGFKLKHKLSDHSKRVHTGCINTSAWSVLTETEEPAVLTPFYGTGKEPEP